MQVIGRAGRDKKTNPDVQNEMLKEALHFLLEAKNMIKIDSFMDNFYITPEVTKIGILK